MKSVLRSLLSWLDRKFPDQLVVHQSEYNSIRDVQTSTFEKVAELEVQIKALQSQMANVNMAMGFAIPKAALLER